MSVATPKEAALVAAIEESVYEAVDDFYGMASRTEFDIPLECFGGMTEREFDIAAETSAIAAAEDVMEAEADALMALDGYCDRIEQDCDAARAAKADAIKDILAGPFIVHATGLRCAGLFAMVPDERDEFLAELDFARDPEHVASSLVGLRELPFK